MKIFLATPGLLFCNRIAGFSNSCNGTEDGTHYASESPGPNRTVTGWRVPCGRLAMMFLLQLCISPALAQVPDSGLDFYELQRVFQVPRSITVERSREIQEMWAYPENVKGRFDALIFRKDYTSAYYRRALSMFERIRSQDRKFLKYQKDVYRTLKDNDDPRPMSAQEKRDALRNQFAHEKIRHHEKMAAGYNQVLKLLDSGRAGPLDGANLDLYLQTLRLNIIHLSKGRNYQDALWMLRRYYQTETEAASQWPFHFYVASTLTHLHRRARESGKSLEKQYRLESLKDRYILNYLELRYGRQSYQYTETFKRLRREAGPLHFLRKEGPLTP